MSVVLISSLGARHGDVARSKGWTNSETFHYSDIEPEIVVHVVVRNSLIESTTEKREGRREGPALCTVSVLRYTLR